MCIYGHKPMKQEKLTIEQFRALAHKQNEGKAQKKNKYGAEKVGGHASQKEHKRSNELKLKLRLGLISNLQEQVKYELIPPQYNECGVCIEQACSYTADFVYTDNETGKVIVEDTKGFLTKDYIIKRKLMLFIHGIRITEI